MIPFFYNLSDIICKAIIQSFYWSTGAALLLFIAAPALKKTPALLRYRLWLLVLIAGCSGFLYPFLSRHEQKNDMRVIQYDASQVAALSKHSVQETIAQSTTAVATSIEHFAITNHSLILILYATGLLLFSVRLIPSLRFNRNLRHNAVPGDDLQWQQLLDKTCTTIGIRKKITFSVSHDIVSPCITGFAHTIVFIPASMYTGLSATQIEMILLHELAHLKHNDLIINLLIQATGCLLFFNPVIWFAIKKCELYREMAADETAARYGDPVVLAETLLQIAENYQSAQQLALSLGNNKNTITLRILNLLHMQNNTSKTYNRPSATITATAIVTAILLFAGTRTLSQSKDSLQTELQKASDRLYQAGNGYYVLVDALKDGLIHDRESYNFDYRTDSTATIITVNGKKLKEPLLSAYIKKEKAFIYAQHGSERVSFSLRGDGVKLEQVFDPKSSFANPPFRCARNSHDDHEIINAMVEDNLLDTTKSAYIKFDIKGISVNGKMLEGPYLEKYRKMFVDVYKEPKQASDGTEIFLGPSDYRKMKEEHQDQVEQNNTRRIIQQLKDDNLTDTADIIRFVYSTKGIFINNKKLTGETEARYRKLLKDLGIPEPKKTDKADYTIVNYPEGKLPPDIKTKNSVIHFGN